MNEERIEELMREHGVGTPEELARLRYPAEPEQPLPQAAVIGR